MKFNVTEPVVSITLKRLVLGRPCSLIHHKSLKSKTELLDGAIAIGDGNAILTVSFWYHLKLTYADSI